MTSSDDSVAARVISSTKDNLDFVSAHDRPETWKRNWSPPGTDYDFYNPFTPQQRYQHHWVPDLGGAPIPVIPT